MITDGLMQALPIKLQGILQGYQHILPELVIAAWILVSIVGDLFLVGGGEKSTRSWRYLIAQVGLILSLILAYQRMEQGIESFVSFHMLWVNPGANAINCLILSIGFIIISINQYQQKSFSFEEKIGFFSILLGSLLTSLSIHFLSIFLSIELMSLGTYLLVGLRKDKEGVRAALPYVLFGMGTSAMLLYGLSLIYGITGTMQILDPAFSRGLATADPYLSGMALALVGTGILFKMSWVPFHPWSPDVMESLPAAWMSWISTAPKIAVAWLGIRLVHFVPVSMQDVIAVLAILTLLVGNLGALNQLNAKRLVAYSSIAHGGFLAMAWLMPAEQGVDSLLFYSLVYSLSTILVFYILDEVKTNPYQMDDMGQWAGFGQAYPVRALSLFIGFVALIGLPPAGTFLAKVNYFSQLWEKYQITQSNPTLALLVIAILMTAISIYYYLRIPFHMYFKKGDAIHPADTLQNNWIYLVLTCGIIASMLFPTLIYSIWKA
jgi:NADH-quinone oxidoreductase subunit N